MGGGQALWNLRLLLLWGVLSYEWKPQQLGWGVETLRRRPHGTHARYLKPLQQADGRQCQLSQDPHEEVCWRGGA